MHKLVSTFEKLKIYFSKNYCFLTGVKHPNIICDGCAKAGIAGIRFVCAQCNNYDLCAFCYGQDLHDLDHIFVRYQTGNSVG